MTISALDKNKKEIFLYMGPHNSGTNFLKYRIFPNIDEIHDVLSENPKIVDIIYGEFQAHPLFLDVENTRAEIERQLSQVSESRIVISDPEFFGSYENMKSGSRFDERPFADSDYRAKMLMRLFPNSKTHQFKTRRHL